MMLIMLCCSDRLRSDRDLNLDRIAGLHRTIDLRTEDMGNTIYITSNTINIIINILTTRRLCEYDCCGQSKCYTSPGEHKGQET